MSNKPNKNKVKKEEALKEEKHALESELLQTDWKTGAAISGAVGAVLGGATGIGIGAQAGAALVIGGSIVSAPVTIPAAIGVVAIGAIGTGISYVTAKNKDIEALKKEGLKKSIEGSKMRLLAAKKQTIQLQQEQKEKQQERETLLHAISTTKKNMETQKALFEKQVKEHGYTRNTSQSIMVMIGNTGQGKSTLGNRICGDISKKGNKGPFGVSAKKNKGGTKQVNSHITTAPFEKTSSNERQITPNNPTYDLKEDDKLEMIDLADEKEQTSNLLIVDTPGWGDVEEANRDGHKNNIVRYLKGCGGVNCFILVMSNSGRIDKSIQQMLTEYETLFHIEFWKHLTIVVSCVDDDDDLEEFGVEDHATVMQQFLKKKFKHLKALNRDIPVIPIGKKIYSKQIGLIMDEIPKEKFTCSALQSPFEINFELLKEKYDRFFVELEAIDNELAKLQKRIADSRKEMQNRKKEIDTLNSKLKKYK